MVCGAGGRAVVGGGRACGCSRARGGRFEWSLGAQTHLVVEIYASNQGSKGPMRPANQLDQSTSTTNDTKVIKCGCGRGTDTYKVPRDCNLHYDLSKLIYLFLRCLEKR